MTLVTYGNITNPVVDIFLKADAATNNGFSVFVWIIVFALIYMAIYKKYNSVEKGLVVAGFVTAILNTAFTIFARLPWDYLWISAACVVLGLIGKAFSED